MFCQAFSVNWIAFVCSPCHVFYHGRVTSRRLAAYTDNVTPRAQTLHITFGGVICFHYFSYFAATATVTANVDAGANVNANALAGAIAVSRRTTAAADPRNVNASAVACRAGRRAVRGKTAAIRHIEK